MKMYRLKSEAVPYFAEKLKTCIYDFETWKKTYNVDENALEEVQPVYLTFGMPDKEGSNDINMNADKLLNIAKQIIALNGFCFALTGSLMCYARGIKTRRKPTDIDLIGDLFYVDSLKVPNGFILHHQEGGGSDLQSVVFIDKATGVKIDIMFSDKCLDDIDDRGLVLADLQEMISVKLSYSRHDRNIESRHKHLNDLLELIGVMDDKNYQEFNELIQKL